MKTDYAQIFQTATAVEKYERVVYAPDSYSSAVNARQRAYLRRLVRDAFPQRRPVQHDFACGTGRALRLLRSVVREAHGYDVSPAMLDRARTALAGPGSELRLGLHEIPADGPLPAPATLASPALVTIFRLLLNVSDEVRDRAISFAARVLPHPGSGLLIVENHGNRASLRHLGHGRHTDDPWFAELSHRQVEDLLARHGFRIITRRGFAVCPPGSYRRRWLRPIASIVDNLASRVPWSAAFATNVLYVARREVRPR
jgi:SAM-dependent methyltransferase